MSRALPLLILTLWAAPAAAGFEGLELPAGWSGVASLERAGRAAELHAAGVDPEAAFWIGSVSKQFAAAAVLRLVADGRLELDAPPRRYLPAVGALEAEGVECSLRHLLHHTCGLPREVDGPLAAVELRGRPGLRFRYSNAGYDLLGEVVAAAADVPYPDYLRATFFEPLGMTSSGAGTPRPDVKRARGGAWIGVGHIDAATWLGTPVDAGARVGAAGNVYASAADLHRWQRALHAGRVLPPAQYAVLSAADGGASDAGEGETYGGGVLARGAGRTRVLWHNGALSPHGFAAFVAWLPEPRISVVLLARRNESEAQLTPRGLAWTAHLVGARPEPLPDRRIEAWLPLFLLVAQLFCLVGGLVGLARGPREQGAAEHLLGVLTFASVLFALRVSFLQPGAVAGWALAVAALLALGVALRTRRWRAAPTWRSRKSLASAGLAYAFVLAVLAFSLPAASAALAVGLGLPSALTLGALRRRG